MAVMAALNLAHDLLQIRTREEALGSDLGGRLRSMRERVESALERSQQLEL